MEIKNIERIITPGHLHWVGDAFRMKNIVPFEVPMERMDPFIGIEYAEKYFFTPSATPRGAEAHPHRGFETVSIIYDGTIAHNDTTGAGGTIKAGETQWLTAAAGVMHNEYLDNEFNKNGGHLHMVQLWVNLPSGNKMDAPKYQHITATNAKKAILPGAGEIEVLAGEYNDVSGAAATHSPMHLYNVRLRKQGIATLHLPATYNTGILMIEGSALINNDKVLAQNLFALFENAGTDIHIEALEDCTMLVLSGEPLNEPIVAHGPFVMNTRQQIAAAINDYNSGTFGTLPANS